MDPPPPSNSTEICVGFILYILKYKFAIVTHAFTTTLLGKLDEENEQDDISLIPKVYHNIISNHGRK